MCPHAKPTTSNREKHCQSVARQQNKELEAFHSAANHSLATDDIEMRNQPKEPPKHITCEASWALLDEPQIVLNKDKLFDTETLEEEVDINTLKGILNTTSPDDKWEDVLEFPLS